MIEIEIGEILYTPHIELKATNVFGINYATQVSSPNVHIECGNWSMEYIEPVSDTDL